MARKKKEVIAKDDKKKAVAVIKTNIEYSAEAIAKGYAICPQCKSGYLIPVEGKGNRVQCMSCGYWTRKQEIDHKEKFEEMRKLTEKQ
jgi:Zn ribbon nucleic-acid-binding protein